MSLAKRCLFCNLCYNGKMRKIILTGGGTAGHCVPNLALVPTLRERGFEVKYIGSYGGIEKKLVENEGIPYKGISSGKLRRYFDLKNLSDPFRVLKGFGEALSILKKEKPDIVFSKGGFVAVPVVRAAGLLNIPVVIHESDMTPGLANRLSFGAATSICCSFKKTLEYLPAGKGVFTGSPIRSGLLKGDRLEARTFTGIREGDYTTLMVIGGSLGAQHVNEAVRSVLPKILGEYNVIHLCGKGKLDPTLNHMDGYVQYDYIDKELPDLFALSDIVISRAGSNAIFEILALKKPNILIPLPQGSSRGDQILNAEAFEKAGYSYVLRDEDMSDDSLIKALDHVKEHRLDYLEKMEFAAESKAVESICDLIDKNAKRA